MKCRLHVSGMEREITWMAAETWHASPEIFMMPLDLGNEGHVQSLLFVSIPLTDN